MRRLSCILITSLMALAACGGDDGGDGNNPDAATDGPGGGVCGVETTTLSTYPATYTGTVLQGGDDLDVAEGACADERGYYGPYGADQVIVLNGLTAGTTYVLELETEEDLGMYVTSTCAAGAPGTGACLLLVDVSLANEVGEFVAPAGGSVFVVIDTADGFSLTNGNYTLGVRVAECTTNAQCTNPATPVCSSFECVQCTNSFQCTTSGAPVCDGATNTCVAGGTMCTGDDGSEPDDGPSVATTVTFPTLNTPTVVNGHAVCSLPAIEGDFYKVTATAAGQLRISAAWTATGADLDFLVYNSTGQVVGQGGAGGAGPEVALATLAAAGDYFIEVYQYEPANAAAATPYTLTLSLPECQDSFDCTTAGEPQCAVGDCVAGPAQCTGDDAADGGTGDDGPAASRNLTGAIGVATALTGRICNTPGTEGDWYRVTTAAAGEGIVANLSWAGATPPDIDVYIWDDQGRLLGTSFWLNPEIVTVTNLPAGTYYLSVNQAGPAVAAAHDYTLSATRTSVTTCTTSADCATSHKTQIFRGTCTGGACEFIAPGTRADGSVCDSPDDCMSGDCSYILFEADAHKSVCTRECTSNANCTGLGTGTFACSTGFSTNVCLPTCASDLECGANINSMAIDLNQPWNYFTCTTASGACSP